MNYLKLRQKLLLLAMFCVTASLLISLSALGLAHGSEERVAKAKNGSPCAGGSRSCEPGAKGVVCNHWVTLIEDSFEGGFLEPPWQPGGWELTNCTSSEGENSIWCEESETPCSGSYYSSGEYSYAAHDHLNIPHNCHILKLSFDYKYRAAEGYDWYEWWDEGGLYEAPFEFLMVYLNWWDPSNPWAEW